MPLIAPAPATRLGAVRVLVGTFTLIYLLARSVHLWKLSKMAAVQFRPTGIVKLIDSPLPALLWHAIIIVTLLLAICFVLGIAHRVLAPLFALALLVLLSYRNSWGMIFHTENLIVLHVAILALVPSADAWRLQLRSTLATQLPKHAEDSQKYGWPLLLLSIVTITAYFLAGIAKLRFGGLGWASGDVLRNHVAVDNLRKLLLGAVYSPLAGPSMRVGVLFTLLAGGSLALELLAPIAIFSRRFARLWVPAMVGFHIGIVALMAILFPYPLTGVAFASFYHAETLLDRVRTYRIARARR